MAKFRYVNGVFKKIPEEKKETLPKEMRKKNSVKNFLDSALIVAMLSGAVFGLVGYGLHLEKEEHQKFVDKANQNPSGMRAIRRDFVRIYQQERQKDSTASVQKLLYFSYKILLREIHEREKNDTRPYNPYDERYNRGGRIYDSKKAGMVFEDLAELSKCVTPAEFERLLKSYPESDTRLLTTLDSKKRAERTIEILRERQKD